MAKVIECLVAWCCILFSVCQARTIPSKTVPDMKCMRTRPGMQDAMGFHCFTPVGENDIAPNPTWSFNGQALNGSSKYHMGMSQYKNYYNGEMVDIYDMHLVIAHVCEEDVGEYGMTVSMGDDEMEESMMLPVALACADHAMCYEDNCNWPEKLVCRSNPDAYCQMDMCRGNTFCMPHWFVGATEITCEDVEAISYFPQ